MHLFKEPPEYLRNHVGFKTLFRESYSDDEAPSFSETGTINFPYYERSCRTLAIATSESEESEVAETTASEDEGEAESNRDWGNNSCLEEVRSQHCKLCALEMWLDQRSLKMMTSSSSDLESPEPCGMARSDQGSNYLTEVAAEALAPLNVISQELCRQESPGPEVIDRHETLEKVVKTKATNRKVSLVITEWEEFIDEYCSKLECDNAISTSSPEKGYTTRSKGPVVDRPNVQPRIMERRSIRNSQ